MMRILTWAMLIIVTALIVWLVVLADTGGAQQLFRWVQTQPAADKMVHLVLFGTFACLANLAMRGAHFRIGRFKFLKASVFVAVPIILEEFSQLFLSRRSFEWLDLAVDCTAIFLGGLMARLLLQQWDAWRVRGKMAPKGKPADPAKAIL